MYFICVMQVGSVNNTFGIKGVQEYCQFFKSIEDANNLRRRISECFERAALPYVSAAATHLTACSPNKLETTMHPGNIMHQESSLTL